MEKCFSWIVKPAGKHHSWSIFQVTGTEWKPCLGDKQLSSKGLDESSTEVTENMEIPDVKCMLQLQMLQVLPLRPPVKRKGVIKEAKQFIKNDFMG